MGNQLAASGAAANFDIQDISNALQLVAPLGGRKRGRLFTSLHCQARQDKRDVVVKVFIRNADDKKQAELVNTYAESLSSIERTLRAFSKNSPQAPCNILFYTVVSRTPQYCMLQRPFVHYSLLERMQTRPFWSIEQRLFACYQVLQGVRQLHDDVGVTHGDIKAENFVATSAGWLYLTDLCPFKPASLPSYNPANFEYFFDNAESSLCSLDPEKFFDEADATAATSRTHLPAMDVYSAMCVAAHIMSDEPLFRLRDALEFRAMSYPEKVTRLRDVLLNERKLPSTVVEMFVEVMCMPCASRLTAAQIIKKYTGTIFPPFFGMLYHNVVPALLPMPPDIQLQTLWTRFDDLLSAATRCLTDAEYADAMQHGERPPLSVEQTMSRAASPQAAATESSGETAAASAIADATPASISAARQATVAIIAPLVAIASRHAKTVDSKAKALHLMKRINDVCDAAVKREVLLPSILHLLRDQHHSKSVIVRVAALKALVAVSRGLGECEMRASECLLYDDLVMPALAEVAQDRRPLVQVEFAQSVPQVLVCALQYLQQRQVLFEGGTFLNTFDFQLHNIADRGWELIKPLFGSENSTVVCAVLAAVGTLVPVLGPERSLDELLPMLMTLLGSPAIEVRRLLLQQIPHVVHLMAPEMVMVYASEGLRSSDAECIFVTLETIRSMLKGRSLPTRELLQLVQRSIPHLAYPDGWVSGAAARVLEDAAHCFDPVDILAHLEAPLRSMLVAEVPLSSMVELHGAAIKAEAAYSQAPFSRHRSIVCVDYGARVPVPDTIQIVTTHIRTAGDVPCDTTYVDVRDQTSLRAASMLWHMRDFHPLPRQKKRLLKRIWAASADPTADAEPAGRGKGTAAFKAAVRKTIAGHLAGGSSAPIVAMASLTVAQQSGTPVAGARSSLADGGGTRASNPNASVASVSGASLSSLPQSPAGSPARDFHTAGSPRQFIVDEGTAKQKIMRPVAAPLAINTMHEGPIYAMGFNTGWMATGGYGGTVRLWDLEETVMSTTGILRPTTLFKGVLPAADATVLFAEFIHQDATASLIACGGTDGVFTIMDAEANASVAQISPGGGNSGGLTSCVPLPRQSLVLVGAQRSGVYAIDLRTNKEVWTAQLPRPLGPINNIVTLRSGPSSSESFALVASTLRGTVALFDLRFRVLVDSCHVADNRTEPIHAMVRAGDKFPSSVVVATERSGIVQLDFSGKREVLTMMPRQDSRTTALLNVPQSSFIVSGGHDRLLRLWDLDAPERSATITVAPQKSPMYVHAKATGIISDSSGYVPRNASPAATAAAAAAAASSTAAEEGLINGSGSDEPSPAGPGFTPTSGAAANCVTPHHQDVITALGCATVRQQQYLLSASREGVVKIWHNQPAI